MVLDELFQNKKISTATHNMYAYRIWNEKTNSFLQDCEDDGESHGGSRLLHLLQVRCPIIVVSCVFDIVVLNSNLNHFLINQILDCRDVMVVVTRWFGGVQLHNDRFKHINNVARSLLQQQGFISDANNSKVSKK
jgi:putative IMPACT (imprinted ancient) family translation regulator